MLRRFAVILGYLLAACLVVGLTIGLVAYGRGYSYNFREHRVVQTGLVIIQSSPGGVQVAVDGRKTKKKTTYRQSFEAGTYTFDLTKPGFTAWHKTMLVRASDVTLAQYVIMLPTDLHPQTTLATAPVTAQSLSHDHKHLAFMTGGADAGVYVYDLGSPKPSKIYTPAAATPAIPAEALQSLEWSSDASHLLVFSHVGSTLTARVMAADGSSQVNLTDQYRFDFNGLQFSGNDWHQLYWVSADGLRRLDLGNQSVSAVLADQIKQFETEPDRVLYVQSTPLGQSLWSLDNRGHKQELVTALPASDHYGLAYTSYRGTAELAVVPSQTGIGTLYSNVFGDNMVSQTVARGVTDASFSPDGHLVLFSGPGAAATYDLDQSSVIGSPLIYSFALAGATTAPVWFDNFHLLINENGHLVWREYDGQNTVDLGASQANLTGFGVADFRSLYVFRPADAAAQQLVNLTIKP